MTSDLLVCVPTLNEELAIRQVVQELVEWGFRFVIIDGQSEDMTVPIAQKMGAEIVFRSAEGKSSAIKKAMNMAEERGAKYLGVLDADGSYKPSDLAKLWNCIGSEKMVVGCRPYKNIAFSRRVANHLMNLLVRLVHGKPVKDMASGMRILQVDAFKPFFDASGFNVEPQLWCLAAKLNYGVKEVPIDYLPRIGKSKSRPVDVAKACLEIIRLRFKN